MTRESGSALFLCLILLVSFTLLGVSMASAYQLQLRVQANDERAALARTAAEHALSSGERWLFSLPAVDLPSPCPSDCNSDHTVWAAGAIPERVQHLDKAWWQAHARAIESSALVTISHLLISEIEVPAAAAETAGTPATLYRLTALGTDPEQTSTAVSESIIARPWVEPADATDAPSVAAQCERFGSKPCGRITWRVLR